MFLEIAEEIVIRTNPNAVEETYFATTGGGGGTCVGYCCTSSSHQGTKPPTQ